VINKLLILKRLNDAGDLLREFEDDHSAYWFYSKAYLFFNKPSKRFSADKELIAAMKFNPYVPLYLFGIRKMPKVLPEYIGIGDEPEAIAYVADSIEVWGSDKNIAHWLSVIYNKMENELNKLCEEKEKDRRERFKEFGNELPS